MQKLIFKGFPDGTFGEFSRIKQYCQNRSMTPTQCIIDCGSAGKLMLTASYKKQSVNNGIWKIEKSGVDTSSPAPDWKTKTGIAKEDGCPYMEIDIPDGPVRLCWCMPG